MSAPVRPSSRCRSAADRDHIQGPADAPVTLVEYGDYECPYCGAAYPIVKEVQERMGDRLRFVFRNFPIRTRTRTPSTPPRRPRRRRPGPVLGDARSALREPAALDDATWTAMPSSSGWTSSGSTASCAEHVHAERVHDDFMSGVHSGVNGTPTFYINGDRHDGSYEPDMLIAAVERAATSGRAPYGSGTDEPPTHRGARRSRSRPLPVVGHRSPRRGRTR